MEKKYTAEDIRTLDAGEHIRLRPKLYFDKCFKENSLDSLPFEVLCHAFDEYLEGNCTKIKLKIWENKCILKYNAGMSLDVKFENITIAETIMTKISACSNYKKHLEVGHEFCELGMATINFASERSELTTVWNEQKGHFKYLNGELKEKFIENVNDEKNYTEILIFPNKNLFEELKFTTKGVQEKAENIQKRMKKLNFIVESFI